MLKLLGAGTICNFWYLGAERDNKRQSIAVPALSKESGYIDVLKCILYNYIKALLPSGGLLEVATTTTPLLNSSVKSFFSITASAMSVT